MEHRLLMLCNIIMTLKLTSNNTADLTSSTSTVKSESSEFVGPRKLALLDSYSLLSRAI